MNLRKNIILLLVVLMSCTSTDEKKETSYPSKEVSVVNDPQEGGDLIDINLSITEIENSNSFTRYHILSTNKNEKIGFLLRIPNYTFDAEGYGVGIRLSTAGQESDNFLRFLYQTYSKYYTIDTLTEFPFAPVASFAYNKYESTYDDSTKKRYIIQESPIYLTVDTIKRNLTFSMEREPYKAIKQLLRKVHQPTNH